MRKYTGLQNDSLQQVRCNKCGKVLLVENGLIKEGCFHAAYDFGYFSQKDGMRHTWDLCENCYDEIVRDFVLPIEVSEEPELL